MQIKIEDKVLADAVERSVTTVVSTVIDNNIWKSIQKLMEEREDIFVAEIKRYINTKEFEALVNEQIKNEMNHRLEEIISNFIQYNADDMLEGMLKRFLEKNLKLTPPRKKVKK